MQPPLYSLMGFDDLVHPDPRIRQTEVARHRKVDSGDNMLQLHVENALSVRHKAWEVFQRFVFPSIRPCYPLIPSLSVSKLLTKFAWRLTVDAFRTHIPLIYPPHSVALGCLYLAALLMTFEQTPPPPSQTFQQQAMTPLQLISLLARGGEWEDQFNIDADHLERKLIVQQALANEHADSSVLLQKSHTKSSTSSCKSPKTLRQQHPQRTLPQAPRHHHPATPLTPLNIRTPYTTLRRVYRSSRTN